MNREEAIKILKEIIEAGWLISDFNKCAAIDACEMAIEALKQEPCDNVISRNDMLDAIGHGTTYTSEELQKIIKRLPDAKMILISAIKSDLDNLDTYTIYMGASQQDKVCVEFKEIIKILENLKIQIRSEK